MNISMVLSQILGISFVVLGLSMLSNKKWMTAVMEEIVTNQGLLWLAGFVTVLLGAMIVAIGGINHNLSLLVILLGWLTLIKGTIILIIPNSAVAYYKKMNNKGNMFVWGGIVIFILGLILLV